MAWRACGDDKAFLDAHQPVDLTFKLGDLLLALGQGTRRIRNLIDRVHQTVNQQIRLKKRHSCVQVPWPLHGQRFTQSNIPRDWPGQTLHVGLYLLPNVRGRDRHALQCVRGYVREADPLFLTRRACSANGEQFIPVVRSLQAGL